MVSVEEMLLMYVRIRQKIVGTKQALDEVEQALRAVKRRVGHSFTSEGSFMMSSYLTQDPVAKLPRKQS